jgi:hypothetical protein
MKIIAIPRNGFGNRMQMLASSYLMATQLNAELFVHWTEQPVFRASRKEIFEEIPKVNFLDYPISSPPVSFELPTFTNFDRDKNRITLKNLRVGDQAFMPTLRRILRRYPEASEIWIESGEKFSLNQKRSFKDSADFRKSRLDFYKEIKFNKRIVESSNALLSQLGSEYCAIHIRDTDRKSETVSNERLISEIFGNKPNGKVSEKKFFIASDNTIRGAEFKDLLTRKGFEVFFDPDKNRDRLNPDEVQASVVDWLALREAKTVVSFGSTTFSYEAVVAGNSFDSRVHLKPKIFRQGLNRISKEFLLLKLYKKLPFVHVFIKGKK